MKKRHAQVLGEFLGDMLKVSTSENFPGFFYRSRAHVMIFLLIIKSNIQEKEISFEDICEIIPKHITSRTTIKTILDHAIKYNYLQKLNSLKDKRKKIYRANEKINLFMDDWIKRNNEIFKNIKNK